MLGAVKRPNRLDRLPEQYFMRLLAQVQDAIPQFKKVFCSAK